MKKPAKPSFLMRSRTTHMPVFLESKFWFWMRVLITSSGCEMTMEETWIGSNR